MRPDDATVLDTLTGDVPRVIAAMKDFEPRPRHDSND